MIKNARPAFLPEKRPSAFWPMPKSSSTQPDENVPSPARGTGRFFVGGDSFPSTHASVSWAIASVIAHEYPGP